MSARKQLVIPEKIKEKYGDKFQIWSYSRLGTYNNCQHEYYLSRILKHKSEDNIYSICGSYAHDILENFYNGKINYSDMCVTFEENFLDVEISDLKFSQDEDKNASMVKKYKDSIIHFFNNHKPVNVKVLSEKEVWVEVNGNVFIGYVDAIHKEINDYIITDYKTSSISEFKGDKLLEKQKQLLLYALGLNQIGIHLENIKIRWNFLKYTNVMVNHLIEVTYENNSKITTSTVDKLKWVEKIKTPLKKDLVEEYPNKNKKEIKEMLNEAVLKNNLEGFPEHIIKKYPTNNIIKIGERNRWVESIKTPLKKDMKNYGYSDIDIEILYTECVQNNNLDVLPNEISDNYKLDDCYVYGVVNKNTISELIQKLSSDIQQIKQKGKSENEWLLNKIELNDSYYCNVLCGVKKHCKFYSKYLDELKNDFKKEDIDILTELENL